MKTRIIAVAAALTSSFAFAATPLASACLSYPNATECLADVAAAAVATEKSAELRIDGYASLVSSMTKAGVRRDDLFAKAVDDETAPVFSRWSLAVARKTYALHFEIDSIDVDRPQKIEALADLLKRRRDGFDRLAVILAACEAREGESQDTVAKWSGVLDRLCTIDELDSESLEKEWLGFSVLVMPMVDAYNRHGDALRNSLAASLSVLGEYEKSLSRKMHAREREGIHGVLAIGHLFNAIALATYGHQSGAAKAMAISLGHLSKMPKLRKAREFEMLMTYAPWIYAKAGMRDEATKGVKGLLVRLDQAKNMSGEEKLSVLAMAIETLHVLEARH